MRVLHVLNELRLSGVETMLRAAAGEWRAQGIRGEILCTGERPGVYAATLRESGYIIHHLPFKRSIAFLMAVGEFFWQNRFDAVHIHAERANFWYAAFAFVTGHRQIVRSMHSTFHFRGALRMRRYVQRLVMRRAFGVRMAACSESVRRLEWLTYGNPSTVIPNWFDSGRYRPAPCGARAEARAALAIEAHTLVVCSVGNCSSVKNHAAVIYAVAALTGRVHVVYLHVGDEGGGEQEKRLAEELGIAGQIRFLGPQLELGSVFDASDVFVMPSLSEGFGIAAVEAMGAGVPAALADVAGLRDFRGMDSSIYWIEPSAAGVESALLHFHQMGATARQAAGERLSAGAHRQFRVETGAAQCAAFYRGEQAIPLAPKAAA
jgi:glycosyltransferase involved in cell wall biosynthesis